MTCLAVLDNTAGTPEDPVTLHVEVVEVLQSYVSTGKLTTSCQMSIDV